MKRSVSRAISDITERGAADTHFFSRGPISGMEIATRVGTGIVAQHALDRRTIRTVPNTYMSEIIAEHRELPRRRNIPPPRAMGAVGVGRLRFIRPRYIASPAVEALGYHLINVDSTILDLRGIVDEFDIAATSQAFLDEASTSAFPPMSRESQALLRMAAIIYQHLFISARGSMAYFYLSFISGDGRRHDWWTNRRGGEIFIRVLLHSSAEVARIEAAYIAHRIAQNFRDWAEKYADDEAEEFPINSVEIRQLINDNFSTFSHVIKAGMGVTNFTSMAAECADDGMRYDFMRTFKWLKDRKLRLSDPGTYKHCFAKAFIISRDGVAREFMDKTEQGTLDRATARMTNKVFGHTKTIERTGEEFFEAFSENALIRGDELTVYNYMMQPVYGPAKFPGIHETKRRIRMLVFAGHSYAIVPGSAEEEQKETFKPVVPFNREDFEARKQRPRTWGVYDLETCADDVVPYCVTWFIGGVTHQVRCIRGLDCMIRFLDELLFSNFTSLNIYAHNGGKFDVILVQAAIEKHPGWKTISLCDQSNRILKLSIISITKSVEKKQVNFMDSYAILPMPLAALAVAYDVQQKKGKINHDAVTLSTWKEEVVRQNITEYAIADSLCLHQCLDKARKITKAQTGIDFIYAGCLSKASISRTFFMLNYDPEKGKLWHLTSELDAVFRKHYTGARTQAFFKGVVRPEEVGKLIFVDFTSLYPSVMCQHPLPCGIPRYLNFDVVPARFYGYIVCQVRGGRVDGWNLIRHKNPGRGLLDPVFEDFTECFLWIDTYLLALENNDLFGYEFRIRGGWVFEKGTYMNECVKTSFALKQQLKPDTPEYVAVKVFINSLYGFLGLKMWERRLTVLTSDRESNFLLAMGHLISRRGDIACVWQKCDTSVRYVPAAAAIAEMAQLTLARVLLNIERAGKTAYYCDTDSILTNATEEELGWPMGRELGELTHVMEDIKQAVVLSPKFYGILYGDGATKLKCKGFRNVPYTSKVIDDESIRLSGMGFEEGIERLTYEDFVIMAETGKSLVVSYSNFQCGRGGWLNATPALRRINGVKKFSGRINKGRIRSDGRITPLSIALAESGEVVV